MKITVVMSDGVVSERRDPFGVRRDDVYARRFADGLRRHASQDLVEVVELASTLPFYVDDPLEFLPSSLKPHDGLVVINVHEELLLAVPELAATAGCRALIVPREDPDWVTPWAIDNVRSKCAALGIDVAFPKPFCSLTPDAAGPAVREFIDHFGIGRPEVRFIVKNGVVEHVDVVRSAPCGDTHFVALNLAGKRLDDRFDWWASKFWASYPCIGSMKMDPQLGDTLSHEAGHILLAAVHEALNKTVGGKS